ncbi:harmonin isoform X3 [Anoplophora glabripennis]|uniref:harmonin isoform X3 n=1 Tax=Anoplophora glabripennis TaxID=217634 RepID=UPI000873D419|nr:harmonin isoform X3 [Anoplophora glabripennis]
MLAMEYCIPHQHKYACSTMSSETLSGSCGSRNNRIRTVRLVRPSNGPLPPPNLSCRHGPSLGFSIRGGREHGTGFFVSFVEPGTEANNQGLRVGDQIIRVNGFPVEDAVHKEVLQLISNHTHLTLKVRSVGMIPVKDKKTDSLSWQIISDNNSSSRSSPQLSEKVHDVRINIMVAPRSKLGCGICKGPDWKPGIFVQFTKEGGIAREAGLRPGDQILYCNNVDFSDIPFNEAVGLMKTSRQLDLVVRKAAGSELFPGESSGYNSSASSVTGDQSPSWSDSKRLSIVKEENLDLEDRLSHLDRLKRISSCKKWNTMEWEEDAEEKPFFKPTIINLSESGTTIKNNGADNLNFDPNTNNSKITDIRMVSQQHETKTVIVEVHRSDVDENNDKNNILAKSSSASSFSSLTSKSSNTSVTSSSLSSAICMEIQRRMQKKVTKEEKPSIDEQLQMKKILKGINTDQQYQHNKLMDEFKKAHQKMFKGPDETQTESSPNMKQNNVLGKDTLDRLAHKELSQKLSERLSNLACNEQNSERLPTSNNRQINANNPPPPPPPPPLENGSSCGSTLPSPTESNSSTRSNTLKPHKTKPKAPPIPVKYSVLSSYNQPPPCPTPDYDTLSISSSVSNNKPSQNISDSVDMESLESFKINNPSDIRPKPPNTYFQKRQLNAQSSNGSVSSVTSLKKPRPVSVTIGEYPSMRRQPGRLDFLQNGTDSICQGKQPITSQFASELTQTLNRSNLRKKTESMASCYKGPTSATSDVTTAFNNKK